MILRNQSVLTATSLPMRPRKTAAVILVVACTPCTALSPSSLARVLQVEPMSLRSRSRSRSRARAVRHSWPQLCDEGPSIGTKELYSKIDSTLKWAKRDGAPALGARTARGLSQRRMDMVPADLVEATLISGALVLEDFDDGLDILLEAEEGAGLMISGKAYFALMRLASAEDRPLDVLALLARTRARGVERTDGLILGAMEAAESVEDWGAVARLYTELTSGPEAAAAQATELESMGNPAVLADMRKERGATLLPSATQDELKRAMELALRAHCERGDVTLALELIRRKRVRGAAISPDEYGYILSLSRRTSSPELLLALRPVDIKLSVEAALEPRVFTVTNRVGELSASLGTVERTIVAGLVGVVVLGGIVLAFGASYQPATSPYDFDF